MSEGISDRFIEEKARSYAFTTTHPGYAREDFKQGALWMLAKLNDENDVLKNDLFKMKLTCDDLRDDNRTHFLKINELQKEREQWALDAAKIQNELREQRDKLLGERDALKALVGEYHNKALNLLAIIDSQPSVRYSDFDSEYASNVRLWLMDKAKAMEGEK